MLELFSKNFRASIIKVLQQANSLEKKKKKGKFQQRHISARKNQMAITELKNPRNKIKQSLDGLSSRDDRISALETRSI